ncbi:F-box protein SKIP23-like [Pistacia vera]|uniref:F-box protein SKIP23-like n=1 Tax=Pistacia vera TaxID=55513 RepID=UPI00126390D2|nr:F-box protein SKIP23-like [Pistacia vera]
MGIYTGGKLGVWRKGDEEWTTINFGSDRIFFEDVVYHNDKFYALTSMGHAITVDLKSLKVSEVSGPMGNGNYKYLVPSCKELFFIDKPFFEDFIQCGFEDDSDERSYPVSLNVFKLDEENHVWFPVMNDLEDRVLFCSSDCSFSISAKEFAGCKKNCVYFTDDSFDKGRDDHPGWDAGIYDLEDDTVGALSDFPEYSKIFWPPPVWLKPTK